MKACKFAVLSVILSLCCVLCIELYKGYCVSFDEYDFFELQEVDADDSERLKERLSRISDMLENDGLSFFLVNNYGTENAEQNIEIFCSSAETAKALQDTYRREGSFESFFSGTVNVLFYTSFIDFADSKVKSSDPKIYIYGFNGDYSTLPDKGEYLAENVCIGQGYSIYRVSIVALVVAALGILVILTMFEVLLSQKMRAIKILNGKSINKIIISDVAEEILGIIMAAAVPCIALYSKLRNLPVSSSILVIVLLFIIADILIIVLSVLFLNMRIVISNAQKIGNIVISCHIVKLVLCVGFIILFTMTVADWDGYRIISEYQEMSSVYEEYEYAYAGEDIDDKTLKKELAASLIVSGGYDYTDGTGKEHSTLIVNENAKNIISNGLGNYFDDKVKAVYVPIDIYDEYIYAESHLQTYYGDTMNALEEYENIIAYEPQDSFSWFSYGQSLPNYVFVGDILYIAEDDAPIIYYYPSGEEPMDVTLLRYAKKNDCYEGETGIRTDIYRIYYNALNTKKFAIMLEIITDIFCVFMLIGVDILSLNLEYRLNALEICIKKLTGFSLMKRYETLTVMHVLFNVLGILVAVLINYGGAYRGVSVGIGLITLVGGLLLEYALIILWEKNNCVKILKGGAL